MNQKGITPILILLLVVVVGALVGGAYLYGKGGLRLPTKQPTSPSAQVSATPNPATDETANWKTFKSNLGFSVKYPNYWPDWSATSQTQNQEFLPDNTDKLAISISLPPDNVSPPTIDKAVQDVQLGVTNPTTQTMVLNGYDVRMVSGTRNGMDGNEDSSVAIFSVSNNTKYLVGAVFLSKDLKEKDEKIFNQMLSTFRFD